ncbi:hypothetical protein P3J6_80171 [Pseudoalteromonas sp. 3J6]|nr:hypothetical protein P3J6_80171 [Pseudoalteromonas sp. 3J6]
MKSNVKHVLLLTSYGLMIAFHKNVILICDTLMIYQKGDGHYVNCDF